MNKLTLIAIATVFASSVSAASFNADALNAKAVVANVPASEIQMELDTWYNQEKASIEGTAAAMSDRVPYNVRLIQAQEKLDVEYAQRKEMYNL